MAVQTRVISRRLVIATAALAGVARWVTAGGRMRAQGLAPLIPDEAVDGAARIFANTDDRTTPNFNFLVLAFASRAASTAAEADLNHRLAALGSRAATPPAIAAAARDGTWPDAPAALDGAHVWRPVIETGSTVIRNTYLVLRDARLVYLWAAIAQLPEPAATATQPPAGAETLLALAGDWFEQPPSDGLLIDRLPGIDLLPHGYVERYHAEDLATLRDGGGSTPAVFGPLPGVG